MVKLDKRPGRTINKKAPAITPLYELDNLNASVFEENISNIDPLQYTDYGNKGYFYNMPNPYTISIMATQNTSDLSHNTDKESLEYYNECILDQIISRLLHNISQNTYLIYSNGFYAHVTPFIRDDVIDKHRRISDLTSLLTKNIANISGTVLSYIYKVVDKDSGKCPDLCRITQILESEVNNIVAYSYSFIITTIMSENILNIESLIPYLLDSIIGEHKSPLSYDKYEFDTNHLSVVMGFLNQLATDDMKKISEFINISVYKEVILLAKMWKEI